MPSARLFRDGGELQLLGWRGLRSFAAREPENARVEVSWINALAIAVGRHGIDGQGLAP